MTESPSNEETTEVELRLTEESVVACQIDQWYPKFVSVSVRTEIVLLPEDFVDFLLRDGLHLPPSSLALPQRQGVGEWEADEEYAGWQDEEDTSEEPQVPEFPELVEQVNCSIRRLGGSVLPKLNWSCPKDASWLSTSGSLKCSNADEVFLLLKGSNSIAHDLCHAFDNCKEGSTRTRPDQFVLALRKWLGLRPEMEFRCFVQENHLTGISQRDVTSFHPVHTDEDHMSSIKDQLQEFFNYHIRLKFPLSAYTFDAYVTSGGKVKLIDFNPFGHPTLPLLFGWPELIRMTLASCSVGQDDLVCEKSSRLENECARKELLAVEMRLVTTPQAVRPGLRALSGVPFDLFDHEPGGALDEFVKNLAQNDLKSGS